MFSFMKPKEPPAPPVDPLVLLAEAQEYLKEDDFEGALDKFDELCSLPVQSPLPLLSRATCRLQLKKYEGVIEDCEKVLKFLNTDIEGHSDAEGCTTVHSLALQRMSKAYKELGDLESAKSSLMRKNAIEHKLGRDKFDNDGGEEDDEKDSEERIKREQQTAEEWKEKGNVEFKKENWKLALEYYRNGLGYNIYHVKLHSNTCMTLIKLKRWSQALKHAEQCIALEPQWVKGYYLKGQILNHENKIEQSREALKQAIMLESNNDQIKSLLYEVEARVDYVESHLRQRKNTQKKDNDGEVDGEDSGNDIAPIVEDVDSDEDYCTAEGGGCRTPKTVKLKITRKDVMDIAVDLCAAAIGIFVVWWLVATKD